MKSRLATLCVAFVASLAFGCGGETAPTCQLTAGTPGRGATSGSISAKGSVSCSSPTNLSLQVCLDYRAAGTSTWNEAICVTASASSVASLEREAATGCMAAMARDYQLRVSGTADGKALAEISKVALEPGCK